MKLKNTLPLLILFAFCLQPFASANKPNVIVILTDDQGWGDLSVHGNTNISTPNIDRLASQGMELERFYVCPICSPTRAEFMTGRYNPRTGVKSASRGEERMDLDETTIFQTFKEAGYNTAAFGKWHNGMQPPYHPNARGIDEFYGFCSGHWGHYHSPMLEHNGEIVTGEGFLIDDFTNQAMDYIEEKKDEPFFVYLPYCTPHSPMQVPEPWWSKFKDNELPLRARGDQDEDLQHSRAALAMCENIDWNVGRVMKKLDDLKLSDNTIVIYFSDNGPNGYRWNEDMKGRKGSVEEGGVRSPFFIRWPGKIKPGTKTDTIAGSIDLKSTLTDLVGIKNTGTLPMDGVSLKPLLLQTGEAWPDRLYVNHFKGNTSVRSQRYRLDFQGKLFDMLKDPGQRTDVSKKHPEVHKELLAAQKEFDRTVVAELPEGKDERPFVIGHPEFRFTQLPARDAIATGDIKRSGNAPNCSFYMNWVNTEDTIYWDADVQVEGNYRAEVYYTCTEQDLGTVLELSSGNSAITKKVTVVNDPPWLGAEFDRAIRKGESYVKDFKPMDLGVIHLDKGQNKLTLSALEIPGKQSIEMRLIMLHRIN
ncbi:MAG: arylsulfatase [Verrucomicrobia bacterium]|nr:arylsulfatase [Verrucomicrobiota bacterium]MDA1068296.1 arylsulfatase [Verrucomicrobiota bacterium]